MKTLLQDAVSPDISDADMQHKILTKSIVANTGLTAAGASLLCTEYIKDSRTEIGDGSERPLSDPSGQCGILAEIMT